LELVSTPKISNLFGRLYNYFPESSSNFIKNLLLSSADFPLNPKAVFTNLTPDKAKKTLLDIYGYGLPDIEKAIASFDNRVLLFNEGELKLDELKVYKIPLPEIFFSEKGLKRITITLTFTPETRSTRGDSYLGNRMEFHLFHTIDPNDLLTKYADLLDNTENSTLKAELDKCEIKLPGSQRREAGCHQKACKEFKRDPKVIPSNSLSLVLVNKNKWISDINRETPFCISVLLEHEKEIDLYNDVRTSLQTRTRIR
jgi:hypothetical protein